MFLFYYLVRITLFPKINIKLSLFQRKISFTIIISVFDSQSDINEEEVYVINHMRTNNF